MISLEWDYKSLVDLQLDAQNSYLFTYNTFINTLRTGDADLRF